MNTQTPVDFTPCICLLIRQHMAGRTTEQRLSIKQKTIYDTEFQHPAPAYYNCLTQWLVPM